jgi:hypothetical protein
VEHLSILGEGAPWFAGWGTLALINAALAQGKNRSGLIWFLLSLPLGPLATLLLVQQSESPLAHLELIKSMRSAMRTTGFSAVKTLPFPQPCYPTGWWSCTMARKGGDLSGFRERGALSKNFPTRYYNADIHKGALAQPEFMREALGE